MKIAVLLCILGAHLPLLTALFVVTSPRQFYTASYGNNITVECRFPVGSNFNANQLNVYWYHILGDGSLQEIYRMREGKEMLQDQPSEYKERVFLMWDELYSGRALLEISQVRVSDAGTYRCAIDLNGVDYKDTALKVTASYENIKTSVTKEKEETEFICQSMGYPLATVAWLDGNGCGLNETANTTYFTDNQGLYNIKSVLRVKANINRTYVCTFWNKELNRTTSTDLRITDIKGTHEEADIFPSAVGIYIIIAVVTAPIVILIVIILFLFWTVKMRRRQHKTYKKTNMDHSLM
uniref:Ig-like domain-containing protein n=1 Tax=Callorhinchus milii TaxID=7868 RepID=A0A4W3HY32_CALMI|eukprot:gi/632976297/ref/XP_007904717.1/ PREDICTED: programmed cell death 1 ligand 2 [Callorhinchus milii]